MADFNRNNRFSKGGNNGGFKRRDFNDRSSRGPVEMHKAICDKCGKNCQIPFRPTNGRPVYCSNCFEKGNNEPSSFPTKSESRNTDQLQELNNKLDKILALLTPAGASKKEVLPVQE